MAGIDYSIPGQIRPIQVESPMNAMAQAMQLRGLQEASQMNVLKTQEYARKAREDQELASQQNELAKIHSSGIKIGSPEYFNLVATKAPRLLESVQERAIKRSELDEKIEERRFKNFDRKFGLYKSFVPTINSIDGVTRYVSAAYNDPDLAPILNQIMPYADALNSNQDEYNRDPENWKLKAAGVSAKDIADMARSRAEETRKQAEFEQKQGDRTAPKWELKKIGEREVLVDTNSFSPTVGQIKPGAEALVDTTPKWIARDIGGSIVYVNENQNSLTFGQQKPNASITKTATPTAPSKTVQLQAELVSAEKTYGKDSPQARQIRDEIEQETGGLERQRIAIDRYRSRKGDGSGSSIGPGTKLEKGERWNEAEQRIETVPGSKLNIAQSNAHGKDRSSLVAVETKTKSAIAKIDEILDPKNQDGFDANFSGMVPYGGFVTGRFAPDSRRKIESLKADMKSAGLDLIRQGGSIGQITEREWPILEAMIAGISPEMTPEAARAEFKKVRAYMNRLKDNAKDAYQTEWGDTQYFKPSPGGNASRQSTAAPKAPAVGTVQNGYKFKGGDPANQNNWEKVK